MTDLAPRVEDRQMRRFLELVADGTGPLNAGLEVGWSPSKTRRLMRDREFAEMVEIAEDQTIESVEKDLVNAAHRGNVRAIQFYLLNRAPERWKDVRHLEVKQTGQLEIGVIHGVKNAALELLQEKGIEALQPGGALDADVIDAEVVEDGEGE